MKKNNKGFTLIELLAVIVILGLLMAIAIPSVTRYITQSRKKTLITTMGNYTGALVNEVNSFEYTLTASNTVYAVPIECIALERGGNSPFGAWYQANDNYFAYVLVQYDEDNSSYRYGFTFKDSAGYGMYPTAQSKLVGNEKNIKTGLSITRPKNGKITTLTALNNWSDSGFEVTSDTQLKVLVSESEGKYGDGINTCTLQQKGSNYAQVEDEKTEEIVDACDRTNSNILVAPDVLDGEAYALVLDNSANPDDELPLIFVRSETPIKAGDTYNSDRYGNIKVLNAYTGFETTAFDDSVNTFISDEYNGYGGVYVTVRATPWAEYSPLITSVIAEDIVRFASMENLFAYFMSLRYADVGNIDVSKNNSLAGVFIDTANAVHNDTSFGFGREKSLTIVGLEKWDTSNITNMSDMFAVADITSIGDISGWDVSSVTNMSNMFLDASSFGSTTLNIGDISCWDVSNVSNMSYMFLMAGDEDDVIFNVGDISKWDTSNVTNMNGMFFDTSIFDQTFDLSGWNVDKVTSWENFNSGVESKVIAPSKFIN